jgi:ParB-like chromosome segregation protein Spo0J
MHVELWDIANVRPYANNPRRNDHAVAAVAASIAAFGFRQPIVCDEQGVIIVGHTRYKAACRLGLQQVPVHMAQGLTPAQIQAHGVADNKTGELAEWDPQRLVEELADLQRMDLSVDVFGFSADELGHLLGEGPSGAADPDAVPELPDEPVTRPGDLWQLGHHRLLCGDAGQTDDVDRLLGGAVVHLVHTDPPYNVRVEPRSHNAIAAGLSSFTAGLAPLRRTQRNRVYEMERD